MPISEVIGPRTPAMMSMSPDARNIPAITFACSSVFVVEGDIRLARFEREATVFASLNPDQSSGHHQRESVRV